MVRAAQTYLERSLFIRQETIAMHLSNLSLILLVAVSAMGCSGEPDSLSARAGRPSPEQVNKMLTERYAANENLSEQVFEEEDSVERLEAFSSEFGPKFYGLPLNQKSITLVKRPHLVPSRYELKKESQSNDYVVPFHAGEMLNWLFDSIND